MTRESDDRSHRRVWRLLLLVLVILPFLPEITIYAVTALGKAAGCRLDAPDDLVCRLAGRQASDIVDGALQAGLLVSLSFAIGLGAIWLAACYLTISKGWSSMTSRLLLALLLTGVFAGLPYIAPNLALAHVANARCKADGGSCYIFGGDVASTAKDVLKVSEEPLPFLAKVARTATGPIVLGAPVAVGMLLLYAVITLVVRIISRERALARSRGLQDVTGRQ